MISFVLAPRRPTSLRLLTMPEYVRCNLCDSDKTRLLYRLRDYRLHVDDRLWNVVKCQSCGLGYVNPRPTPGEIAFYYPTSYFHGRNTDESRVRYEIQAKYVPNSGRTLLDIGTAGGDFLLLMRSRGWSVTGIEPAERASNPHDLTIHRLRFPEDSRQLDEQYDVITAWAVFEHLHNPLQAFREAARLLRPGGQLIIQVPNLKSVYGRYSMQEDVPRHLYFFNRSTLAAYARCCGLSLRNVIHTTDLFGGSGRGVGRLALVRALGRSTDEFFTIWRTPRRERFRRWPILALPWTALAVVEHIVLADRVVRAARISGQIVGIFENAPDMRNRKQDQRLRGAARSEGSHWARFGSRCRADTKA